MSHVIGIDLGTTNSLVAHFEDGRRELIVNLRKLADPEAPKYLSSQLATRRRSAGIISRAASPGRGAAGLPRRGLPAGVSASGS